MMDELKPNSHRYKEEQKSSEEREKVKKVIKGTARTRKKSEFSKLSEALISEDASNVKSYVLMDVLLPALKKAVYDVVTNGIDMILYGESGHSEKRRRTSDYVSYRDYSKKDERRYSAPKRTGFDFDEIIFDSRGEAEAVLDKMGDMIDQYDSVSVADLYDMVELTAPYTSYRYGWISLGDAKTVRVRDGYVLKLPRAVPIER